MKNPLPNVPSKTSPQTAATKRAVPKAGLWRQRILGGLRLSAYVFAASLVCAGLGARVVYADFKEATLGIGRELSQLNDVLGTAKTVFINGEAMNVSTAFTDQSPTEVLDRFERVCADHPTFVAQAMSDIPKTLQAEAAKRVPDKNMRLGIIRSERNGEGALTCFTDDRPSAGVASSLRDFPDRVRAFAKSQDLTEFGRFRYVYVSESTPGAPKKTHVTTVWTEGSFNVGRMFPANGDAAGFDSTLVPRPDHSKRILSATSQDVPYGVHVYEVADRRSDVRGFYDAAMSARGWTLAINPNDDPAAPPKSTVVYLKDGMMLYVTLVEKDLHTMVTTVETAREGTPTQTTVGVSN